MVLIVNAAFVMTQGRTGAPPEQQAKKKGNVMKAQSGAMWLIEACWLLVALAAAQAQSHVDSPRIGCLDVQKTPNLTAIVAGACNGKQACSYKAPTENQYRAAGVQAATRPFCTQGMEIAYQCSGSGSKFISVPGDAWDRQPAELYCEPPSSDSTGPGILVTGARIACLDIQKQPNLTALVASACNGKASCSYKAPTESQYRAAGVAARTRPLWTQAMEVAVRLGHPSSQAVMVPGTPSAHPPSHPSFEPPHPD